MKLNDFKIRDLAGETVIILQGKLVTDMTKIIAPNSTAIWLMEQLKDAEFTQHDVSVLLVEKYGIEPPQADSDAETWITQMENLELLVK